MQYMGFRNMTLAQDFLLANTDYAIGGVYFIFDDPDAINPSLLNGFLLQTNTTVIMYT